MHRIRMIGRPVALLAVAAVLLAIVAWFSGSVTQDRASAELNWGEQYYVSCADTYLDVPPATTKGAPPGVEDVVLSAKSLSRGEPSQTEPGNVDLTQVVYIGPDMNLDTLPDAPPSALPCKDLLGGVDDDIAQGQLAPENNRLDNDLNYAIQSISIPTVGQLVTKGAELNLEYTTCTDVATSEFWQRTDVVVVMVDKGPKAVNYGLGTLYTEATSPTDPDDPRTCGTPDPVLWVNMYPFVIVTQTRDATTDHPDEPTNVLGIAAGDLLTDPDGPSPKVKGEKQGPDGISGELAGGPYERNGHVSPYLADDWDGDGCPDWDELDRGLDPANGLDPFNPHDCNQAVNIGGIYRIRSVVAEATKDAPGAYYHCIGDMQQDGNDLGMRLLCYIDIPGVPVNPQAGPESGDGYEGLPPPAPYGDVDDVQTELTGIHDKGTNEIIMSGCFEDRDGASALGNVYVESTQDAHTGKGTMSIWAGEELADCLAGTPQGTAVPATVESVKINEKGPCIKDGPQCAAGGLHDSDGDNCPDKNELSNNQQQGGLRDPYNRWDYMNPTHDGQNRVDDILATVNQYFIDKGNPDYDKSTDRTAVIGANPWNLGPPNGQQRVDDILASVKSYFHDCDGGKFDDPNDEPNE